MRWSDKGRDWCGLQVTVWVRNLALTLRPTVLLVLQWSLLHTLVCDGPENDACTGNDESGQHCLCPNVVVNSRGHGEVLRGQIKWPDVIMGHVPKSPCNKQLAHALC